MELAHLKPLPPVLFKLFDHVVQILLTDFKRLRTVQYQIVDDDTFTHYFQENAK